MGVAELVILLLVVAVLLLVASRVAARGSTRPAAVPLSTVAVPAELQARIRDLCQRDQRIGAIKELRAATGLGLLDAKNATDAIAAGRPLPTPPADRRPPADLATRARDLLAAGQEVQAVHLVTTETGMSLPDAETFVRSLAD